LTNRNKLVTVKVRFFILMIPAPAMVARWGNADSPTWAPRGIKHVQGHTSGQVMMNSFQLPSLSFIEYVTKYYE
jgi:hypothetical protein